METILFDIAYSGVRQNPPKIHPDYAAILTAVSQNKMFTVRIHHDVDAYGIHNLLITIFILYPSHFYVAYPPQNPYRICICGSLRHKGFARAIT